MNELTLRTSRRAPSPRARLSDQSVIVKRKAQMADILFIVQLAKIAVLPQPAIEPADTLTAEVEGLRDS